MVGFMRSVHVKGSAMLVAVTVCVYVHNTVVGSMSTLVPLLAALSSPKAATYHEAQSWASRGDTITGWHRTGNLITARSQHLTGSSTKTQIQWGEDSFFYWRMHKASTLYNILRPSKLSLLLLKASVHLIGIFKMTSRTTNKILKFFRICSVWKLEIS